MEMQVRKNLRQHYKRMSWTPENGTREGGLVRKKHSLFERVLLGNMEVEK